MQKLTAFIDGKATKLLNPLLSTKTGNVYWAASKQASGFGVKVDSNVLPNGHDTVISVGMAEFGDDGSVTPVGNPITIPLVSDKDARSKVRGSVTINVPGHGDKVAEATINDFGDGTYNLKVSVHGERGKGGGGKRSALGVSDILA